MTTDLNPHSTDEPRRNQEFVAIVLTLVVLLCITLLVRPNLVKIGDSLNLTLFGLKLVAGILGTVALVSALTSVRFAHRSRMIGLIGCAYVTLIALGALGVVHVYPTFARWQQKADAQSCTRNLLRIEHAKEMYASHMQKQVSSVAQLASDAAVGETELSEFLPSGSLKCPSGGKYICGAVGQTPFCSVHGSDPEDPSARPLAPQEVERIKANFSRLQKNMTEAEVIKALGIDMTKRYSGSESGPASHLACTLVLCEGNTLLLVFDASSGTAQLLSAQLGEKQWPSARTEFINKSSTAGEKK